MWWLSRATPANGDRSRSFLACRFWIRSSPARICDLRTTLLRSLTTKLSGTEGVGDPARGKGWVRAMSLLPPPHSLRIMEDLLSREPLPYFYALLQSDTSGRFDAVVDRRRDEGVFIGQARVE